MRSALVIAALATTSMLAPMPARSQNIAADSSSQLVVPGGHLHTIKSKVNGKTYMVAVVVPEAYVRKGPRDTTRYPTFYVTDGEVRLSMLIGMRILTVPAGQTPPPAANPILVGIWGGGGRDLNYTPALIRDTATANEREPDGSPKFGGAAAFLRVLKEEIIPLVDRVYRTSGDRGLYGHSFGGLFATYALFEEPNLFTRYGITSPSLWWDYDALLRREPAFAKAHPSLAKAIYLSVGSEEGSNTIGITWQLMRQICSAADDGNYKGLRILAETLQGETHASPLALWRALRALYGVPGAGVPQPHDVTTC